MKLSSACVDCPCTTSNGVYFERLCIRLYAYASVRVQKRCILRPLACRDFSGGIRCVRLEAALRRMISVWHHSTARAIREQMDPYAFESLSLHFDVIHWSFCAVPLQVEHTYWNEWGKVTWEEAMPQMPCFRASSRSEWRKLCRYWLIIK